MLICIDAGNSSITYGIYKENELVCTFKTMTQETTSIKRMYDDFMLALKEYGLLLYDMEFAMISNVVERLNSIFKEFCKKINIECYFIEYNSPLGLTNTLKEAVDLAADTYVGCYQATYKYPLPLVVIDLGSVTNITLVNEKREIEGGVIYPGIISSYRHVASMIAPSIKITASPVDTIIGKDKKEAMNTGMLYGSVNAINGILSMIREDKGYEYMNVIITGGLGFYLSSYIDGAIYDENLIIDGLNNIYNEIGKKLYLRTKDKPIISSD